MMSKTTKLAFCSAAASAVFAVAGAARSEVVISAEAKGDVKFTDPVRGGPSAQLGVGYSFDTYPVLVVPEVVASGGIWPGKPLLFPFRATAGIRVGFTAVVEPQIYTHLGYGFIGRDATPDPGFERGLSHGFAIDAGAGVDYRLQREITLGGVLGYEGLVAGRASAHGLAFGVRFGYWL